VPAAHPTSLPENAELAFIGEEAWLAARLTKRQTEGLASAQNPSGRPNTDVLRNFIGIAAGQIVEQTQIDFPLHFTEQEAALYHEPFNRLRAVPNISGPTMGASLPATPRTQSHEPTRSRKIIPASRPTWWINPHANSKLRTALARLERYVATPQTAKIPQWSWIDSHVLPDATLLATARDDDFTFGLLQSRFFFCWWRHYSSQLSPTEIVASFPFPWPPATLLSALTRTQEELRHAIARAARSGNQAQIDSSVATAYGWSIDLTDGEILAQLLQSNRERIRR
jgi:hypothetical protein